MLDHVEECALGSFLVVIALKENPRSEPSRELPFVPDSLVFTEDPFNSHPTVLQVSILTSLGNQSFIDEDIQDSAIPSQMRQTACRKEQASLPLGMVACGDPRKTQIHPHRLDKSLRVQRGGSKVFPRPDR